MAKLRTELRIPSLPVLLLCVAGAGLGGCLAPQEIEQVDPQEPGNASPSILSRSPVATTVVRQEDCGDVSFQLLGVRDRDLADVLEVRWFVNYGPLNTAPLVPAEVIPPPPDGAGNIRIPAPFTIPARSFSGQQIVVEAVVSDGFDPDPAAEPRGRAVRPGKGHDETSWIVRITDDEAECFKP